MAFFYGLSFFDLLFFDVLFFDVLGVSLDPPTIFCLSVCLSGRCWCPLAYDLSRMTPGGGRLLGVRQGLHVSLRRP